MEARDPIAQEFEDYAWIAATIGFGIWCLVLLILARPVSPLDIIITAGWAFALGIKAGSSLT
jgi:hypothetical protein